MHMGVHIVVERVSVTFFCDFAYSTTRFPYETYAPVARHQQRSGEEYDGGFEELLCRASTTNGFKRGAAAPNLVCIWRQRLMEFVHELHMCIFANFLASVDQCIKI